MNTPRAQNKPRAALNRGRLLIAQGIDGFEGCRFTRRVPAEKYSDGGRKTKPQRYGKGAYRYRPALQLGNKHRRPGAAEDAEDSSRKAHDQRFNQKLQQHVAAAGAYGHAGAYFTGAFGNGNKHDIHDADTAHDKRHAGNGGEQDAQRSRCLVRRVADVGLRAYGETGSIPARAFSAVDERLVDLLTRLVNKFFRTRGGGKRIGESHPHKLFLNG